MANPLLQAARRIYAERGGSNDETKAQLILEIKGDADILEAAIRLAADTAMASARHAARAIIIAATPAAQAPKVFSPEFAASVEISCGRFYSWPLTDGTLLADATKDKLVRDATLYRRQAAGCARNGRFLELVAARLREGQQVREAYTEEQLARTMRRAERDEAVVEPE